jgi:hypothetical protein
LFLEKGAPDEESYDKDQEGVQGFQGGILYGPK